MTTQTKRRSIFERFMSKTDAAEAEGVLTALQNVLDNAGVEKKELDFDKGIYKSMLKALSKEKGILEALAKAVDGLLTKVGGEQPDELRNKIIATVMSHLSQVGIDGEGEEVINEEEEPTGDEMPIPEDEEEEEGLMNLSKTLLKENNAMHEDIKALAELVPAFIDIAASVKQLVPLVEASTKVEDMGAEIAALQKKIAGQPRVASRDNSNVVKDEEVLTEIKKGTETEETFLGIRLAPK